MKDNAPAPSTDTFFVLYATYAGLLMVALTSIFWYWSGMASAGCFYLVLVAPILMAVIAYRNRKKRFISPYYMLAYKAGWMYFIIAPLTFFLLVGIGTIKK
jgi:hypothetical protein